jgi:putative hemolysin
MVWCPYTKQRNWLGIRRDRDDSKGILTLGGMAMARMGRIPTAGDHFDWHGVRFEILDMDGRRVDKLLAIPPASNDEPDSR